MHSALTLGPVRLHAYTVVPGREGDGRRLAAALHDKGPRVVACEVTPAHALALRQSLAGTRAKVPFLARLPRDEAARVSGGDPEDPFEAAARYARDVDATLVALLPPERAPGFFERRRLKRLVATLPAEEDAPAAVRAVERVIRGFADYGATRAEADDAAAARLAKLLFEEGRAPVAAVLTPARQAAVLEALKPRVPPSPRSLEPRRETAHAEVPRHEPYPAYR